MAADSVVNYIEQRLPRDRPPRIGADTAEGGVLIVPTHVAIVRHAAWRPWTPGARWGTKTRWREQVPLGLDSEGSVRRDVARALAAHSADELAALAAHPGWEWVSSVVPPASGGESLDEVRVGSGSVAQPEAARVGLAAPEAVPEAQAPLVVRSDDAAAEYLPVDDAEVEEIRQRFADGDYSVEDRFAPAKTRGSGQHFFARAVKRNYDWRCALTGIETEEFLVASHIVPWSIDVTIRTDPTNGICLSTFVDRAFDTGFLEIHPDYTVQIDWARVGSDAALADLLRPYDGRRLAVPASSPPNPEYLRRRLGDVQSAS